MTDAITISVDPHAEPKPKTYATITLVKVAAGVSGTEPVGSVYTYTYKSLNHDQARSRAAIALVRDNPKENPMNWQELQHDGR